MNDRLGVLYRVEYGGMTVTFYYTRIFHFETATFLFTAICYLRRVRMRECVESLFICQPCLYVRTGQLETQWTK